MLVKISCARCKGSLMLNEEDVGRLVRCPKCKKTFPANRPEREAEEPGQPTFDRIDEPILEITPLDLQPEPAPAPRPRPVEPRPRLTAPLRRSVARRSPVARFRFSVDVLDDSSGKLDGRVDAVTHGEGLELRDGSRLLLFAPVGTPAEHFGNNEVEVDVEGRRVRLEVRKGSRSQHLAHDLVRFLNEERGPLKPERYRVSRALLLTAIGIPVTALVVLGAFLLIRALIKVPRIDESAWREFRPPGAPCRLLMPGTPVTKQQFAPGVNQPVTMYAVELKRPNSVFIFTYLTLPPNEVGRIPLNERFEGAKIGMVANTPGATFISQRDITLDGQPGREYVLDYLKRGKMTVRIYFVDNRELYMLLAGGDNFEPDTPDVVKFFDSLELLGRQPGQQPGPQLWQPPRQQPPPWQQPPPTEKPALPLLATLGADARGPLSVSFFPSGDRLLANREIYAVNGWFKQGRLAGNSIPSVTALAPNGQTAAVADPGQLDLVDVASGRRTKLVQGGGGERPEEFLALAFSPDSKALAGHTGSTLILWDVAKGTRRATQAGQRVPFQRAIPSLAFSPDHTLLATSAGDQTLALRDPVSGEVQHLLTAHPGAGVTALAFSPDGKLLGTAGRNSTVKLWSLETRKELLSFRTRGGPLLALAFAPDGRTLAGAGPANAVTFWDAKDGRERLVLKNAHPRDVHRLAYSPNGRLLVTSGEDRTAKVWDASSLSSGVIVRPPAPGSKPLATLPLPSPVQDVCVGGDGRFLILHLPRERKLVVFDTHQAKIVKSLPVAEADLLLAAGRDTLIVAVPGKNLLRRWNLTTFKRELSHFSPNKRPIKALAMGSASAGPLVLARDSGVELLDPQTLQPSDEQVAGGGLGVGFGIARDSLHVSANGQVIVAGPSLLVRQGKEYKRFPAPDKALPGPDGQTVYTPGRLYTAEGKPLGEHVGGHGHMVWYVPALQGPSYVSLNQVLGAGIGQSTLSLSVHRTRNGPPLDTRPDLEAVQGLVDWFSGQTQPFDRHVFLIPDAKLLVILPSSKDRLVLHRFDFDKLPRK
jgi:WD40 repeat protein